MNIPVCQYNATMPVAPQVVEAMLPYQVEHFGNPYASALIKAWRQLARQ